MLSFSNEERKKKKKKIEIPDITIDDIHQRNFKTDPSWPRMKYLEAVIIVALDKFEEAKNHDEDNNEEEEDDINDDGDREKYFLKKRQLMSEKFLNKPMMVPTLNPTLKFKIKNTRETEDEEKHCFFSQKEKSKKRDIDVSEENCPELPQEFRAKIKELNCPKEAVFLIQKSLTSTDVSKEQSRLSMPFGQLKNDFLEYNEKIQANERDGLKVNMFIEPSGKESEMVLRRWDMKKKKGKTSSMYTMINKWNEVRKRNGLKAGDVIQVWAFRNVEKELGLALVRVQEEEKTAVLATTEMGGDSSASGDHV